MSVPLPEDFERPRCPICEADDAEPLAARGAHGLPTFTALCRRCGLVYLCPRWTKARYDRFYQDEFDRAYRAYLDGDDDREDRALAARRGAQLADRLRVAGAPAPRRALDIGAGTGWILQALAAHYPGLERCGIEPSERCARMLAEEQGITVVARDVDTDWHRAHAGAFDLVILRHVLEHLLDPAAVLAKIRTVLAPGGVLYLAVPDMMNPRGSLEGHWFRNVHVWYFSQPTLAPLAAKTGFRTLRLTAEAHEVWGVFAALPAAERAGSVTDGPARAAPGTGAGSPSAGSGQARDRTIPPAPFVSAADQQRRVLRAYRRRLRRRAIVSFLPRVAAALVPRRLKDLLPAGLRNAVYRTLLRR